MSKEETGVSVREAQEVVQQVGPSEMVQLFASMARDPNMDPDKMERLMAMHERLIDREAKVAFADALHKLQAEIPQIQKNGLIVGRNNYALIEDYDVVLRPLMDKYGFSMSFNEESTHGDERRYGATLLHVRGHSETKYITLPLDKSGGKQPVQSAGSTSSYAKRYLYDNHFNIVKRGQDDDGMGGQLKPISEEQAKDIEVMLQEVKGDKAGFLRYMGVSSIAEIPQRDHGKAIASLEAKRRTQNK